MFRDKPLIRGAFILTAASFATRGIGFFYRIYLSRTFGEENIGLYQLIFPIFALGTSFTCAGLQTAISRLTAKKHITGTPADTAAVLYSGIATSLFLSLLLILLITGNADLIAQKFILDKRCSRLLLILAMTFPFASVHSCICGYYLGLKQTKIPALSQLAEQLLRVGTVFLLCSFIPNSSSPSIIIAIFGLLAGEASASFFCLYSLGTHNFFTSSPHHKLAALRASERELLVLSIPLTANRVLLNILQSIEAVFIPIQLREYGLNIPQSLSLYGVLTGMALPCILFPSAISNSISTMLLPTIAELQFSKKNAFQNCNNKLHTFAPHHTCGVKS